MSEPEPQDNSEAAVRRRLQDEARMFAKMARQPPPAGGPPTERIHPAASVILVRDAHDQGGELEVLLARRSQSVRFMPGAWVFPGGKLDEEDGPGLGDDEAAALAAFKVCAVREADEEVGVALPDPSELVWFSHWITPQGLPHRFDTRFFLAPAPAGAQAEPDRHEVEEARWITPSDALNANAADQMTVFFPTIKQLERLIGLATYSEAVAVAHAQPIVPIMPKVIVEDGEPRVALPGDPGYDETPPFGG